MDYETRINRAGDELKRLMKQNFYIQLIEMKYRKFIDNITSEFEGVFVDLRGCDSLRSRVSTDLGLRWLTA